MNRTSNQISFSALSRHRLLLCIVIGVTFAQLLVSSWALQIVQRQVAYSVSAVARSRVDQLENSFTALSENLKRRLVAQSQLSQLEQAQSEDVLTRIQARARLIDDLFYIVGTADSEYSLFYFFPESGEFVTSVHSRYISFPQRADVEQAISGLVCSGYRPNSNSSQWTLLQADGEHYAVQLYQYNNVWIGSCIPASALIQPLRDAYLEGESFPLLLTAEGDIAAGGDALDAAGLTASDALKCSGVFWRNWQRWLSIDPAQSKGGFQIRLFLRGYGQFEIIVLAQACVLFVVTLLLGIVIMTMSYTQKKILRPLRIFTEGLKAYDPEKPLLLDRENEIQELASVSEQFNNLIKEVLRLRIDIYEKELAHQKIQMDYMQLQIQPHFFLNSLNIINTMARQGDCGGIAGLSEATTKYLRYIFQSDQPLARLADELQHIRDYLSIMEVRYPDRFTCDICTDEESLEQSVPPLLLQTFVENALKHGIKGDRKFEVSVSTLLETLEGREVLTIFVTDNGCGFSRKCLDVWSSGRDLERVGNGHIGIANARKRLELMYQGAAEMMLYNSPMGGAVVELHIPVRR